MATRSRVQSDDWNPMRDDYDNSNYDPQGNNLSESFNLDHCRLYIRNIPPGLSVDGLRTAFSKYGTLTECFINSDPLKRYGLVAFKSPGEAKHAMMNLNRTEPLNLNINIAFKAKPKSQDQSRAGRPQNRQRNDRQAESSAHQPANVDRPYAKKSEDSASICTKTRRPDLDTMNGDDPESSTVEDDLLDTSDPEILLKLEELRVEQYRLAQEEILSKQRILLLEKRAHENQVPSSLAGNRSITQGGKLIMVPNAASDRQIEVSREDALSISGIAESWQHIPGLQREFSRACVVCGVLADACCARCGVTPYCGVPCQRRDWNKRHRAVCHNLARIVGEDIDPVHNDISSTPGMASLRYPGSVSGQVLDNNFDKKPFAPKNQNRDTNLNQSHDKSQNGFDNRVNRPNFNRSDDLNCYNHENRSRFNRSNDDQNYRNSGFNRDSNDRQNNRGSNQTGHKFNRNDQGGYNRKVGGQNRNEGGHSRNDDRNSGNKENRNFERKTERPPGSRPPLRHERKDEDEWAPGAANAKPTPKPEHVPEPTTSRSTESLRTPRTDEARTPRPLMESPVAPPKVGPSQIKPVTPVTKLVPLDFIVGRLNLNDTVFLEVTNESSKCFTSRPGFVCVSMHDSYAAQYEALCDDYSTQCEQDNTPYMPNPGDTFSLHQPEEGGWYRARCLAPNRAALLDAAKVVSFTPADKCRKLGLEYVNVPEFSSLLEIDGVNIGDSLKATLLTKNNDSFRVSVEYTDGKKLGEGSLIRWLPTVELPATPENVTKVEPEIPRPPMTNNSKVVLVDYSFNKGTLRMFVRSSDRAVENCYNLTLQDVAMAGTNATPLKEPPVPGQVVIGQFTDDIHYRALVKRRKVADNKYMLEYIEFGNEEITKLERLFPCPPELDVTAKPTKVSKTVMALKDFAPEADKYLNNLKDTEVELVLTLPSNEQSLPSGSEANLQLAKNGENVTEKIKELCNPEWKKMEEKGADLLKDAPCIMFSEIEYEQLPLEGCEVVITEHEDSLEKGAVFGYKKGSAHARYVYGLLTERLTEYCNSEIGKQPYLPKHEELCIAMNPATNTWCRAALLDHESGKPEATILYLDYGAMKVVPVTSLRKMLRQFVHNLPALAASMEIKDFPKNPTPEMLERARHYLEIDSHNQGTLFINKCEPIEVGFYVVTVQNLIKAMLK